MTIPELPNIKAELLGMPRVEMLAPSGDLAPRRAS